jgi:hypothetical protein
MTNGISPKAVLACLLPSISTLVYVLIAWAFTGEFGAAETRTAITGAATSLLALVGAYVAPPGDVTPPDPGTASDALLSPDVAQRVNTAT